MKFFNKSHNLIIVGCGTIGSSLATDAFVRGFNVTVIDLHEVAFYKLPASYRGFTIVGDGAEIETLESAGIQDTDILIASTNDDDINILISQTAKIHYNVQNVITKLNDQGKTAVCDSLHITAICPAQLFIHEAEKALYDKQKGESV
jgi:K+ transport systems, NAD-binding component